MKYHAVARVLLVEQVAPHWGAWIEMRETDGGKVARICRTPLGCVD